MVFRVLNVAEKNDAAKEIARIMSRGSSNRREGFSRYNKIYEYEYHLLGRQCAMTMTSVSGHLQEVEFIAGYQKWSNCQPLALFNAPIEKRVPFNMEDIKRTIEKEVRRCQALVIWTDCDREGENIGFEVINVCLQVKPRIDVYRARFSEITPASIARACANLMNPDELTSFAVDVRQELDLRIGAAFTRFQTLRLQKCFPEVLSDQVISYGSCQFPTLGFVVQRYKEILAFVEETFFKIKVRHVTPDGEADFHWKRVRLFHELACVVLHETCLESPMATVVNLISKPKSKWRPLPLDTVELEKLASRKLKINAKETMRIAEKLYNQGLISYPRTETNIFPSSMDLNSLIELQTVDSNWGQFAANVLAEGAHPRQGKKTDNAHPPIHPTKYTGALSGNEKRLYEFVVRHFLACCSKDAQGIETTVEIDIANERFTAKGLTITARNYLDVYPYDKWCDKTLPVYHLGDSFMPTSIDMVEGQTEPPSLLTEADLIALMEKHGIGTDATHAEHIEKIKARNYVGIQNDGTFVPGELGMGLVDGYDAMGFEMSKPHLRAELESDLKKICLGQKQKDDVLNEQIRKYKDVFVQTCEYANQIDQALAEYFGAPEQLTEDPVTPQNAASDPVFPCPTCQAHMCVKRMQDQKLMIGCMRFPECRSRAFFPSFVLDAQVTNSLCSRCAPRPVQKIQFKFKRGSVPPMMDLDYFTCVLCDERLQHVLDFRLRSRTNATSCQGNNPRSNQFRNNGNRNSASCPKPSSQMPHQEEVRGRPQQPLQSVSSNRRFSSTTGTQPQRQGNIVCTCGESATKLTVRKEGPNTGREFYKCAKRENSCNFFLWADELEPDRALTPFNHVATNSTSNFNRKRTFDAANQDQAFCRCRLPAVVRTVQKAGPNQHRQFYCCSKPRAQSCNFFEWFDPGVQNFPTTRNVPRADKKARCCSNCRQPGHTRNKCPRK